MRPTTMARTALETMVVATVVLLLWQSFLCRGLIRPVRVFGPSMAPACAGQHADLVCRRCRAPYAVGAELWPRDHRLVCPNCGQVEVSPPPTDFALGTRVLIDLASWSYLPVRRWQLAAVQDPEVNNRWDIKRIVGLPGERIEIRDGDIYVNGQLAPRTWAEIQAMAVLVHDQQYALPAQDESVTSEWRCVEALAVAQDQSRPPSKLVANARLEIAPGRTPTWLEFHHVRPMPPPAPQRENSITDLLAYNQGLAGEVFPVRDTFVMARLQRAPSSKDQLELHYDDGHQAWQWRWTASNQVWQLFRGGRQHAIGHLPAPRTTWQLVWGHWDRAFHLRIDNQELLTAPTSAVAQGPGTAVPFRIGLGEGKWVVANLQVWRDVLYLAPTRRGADWQLAAPLGSTEFFLLGDNSPASRDSRMWPSGRIHADQLLGRVLPLARSKSVR